MSEERSDVPPAGADGAGFGEAILRWIERRDLQVPAAILLSMHRPLMPLAWSAAMVCGGLLAPLFGPDYYERIEALRDPAVLDRMIRRLEGSGGASGDGAADE